MQQRWSRAGTAVADPATSLAHFVLFAQAVAAEFSCSQLAVAAGASMQDASIIKPQRSQEV